MLLRYLQKNVAVGQQPKLVDSCSSVATMIFLRAWIITAVLRPICHPVRKQFDLS